MNKVKSIALTTAVTILVVGLSLIIVSFSTQADKKVFSTQVELPKSKQMVIISGWEGDDHNKQLVYEYFKRGFKITHFGFAGTNGTARSLIVMEKY